jgi:biotin carboxyl carrier protein
MAHTYTPGLTVTPRTVVSKRRSLPLPGTVLVDAGAVVTSATVVARAELPGKVHVVNLVNQLGILPEDLPDYMVKREGDRVQQGDILAETKPFLAWFKTQVRAPVTGTVETISTTTGQVILREPPQPVELFSFLDGTVAEVLPGQGVRVETTCALIQGIFGIGGETWGTLAMGVASPEEDITAAHFTAAHAGQIVVGGAFVGAEALLRAKSVGVKGIVVGGMDDKDLRTLLGYDLGVAITGTETVGFTLVLTEGFGRIPMAHRTFELLRKLNGRKASLSGATQIRAGVIRPEIIVPLAPGEQIEGIVAGQSGEARGGVKVGDPVRIIRAPFFGRIGRVVGLPSDLQMIPTESRVRVMEVQFTDGSRAVIPRANIEVIEG